jgi:simple sugar transport system substrate-binding protein
MRKRLLLTLLLSAFAGHAQAAGLPGAPPPFDHGGVKVALVSLISEGDFFQAYRAGAQREAKALGIDLRVFPGRGDAAAERDAIQQAINLGVKGLVIDHGMPETTRDIAQQALDAGIKVVGFDVDLNNPRIPQVEQSDQELAQLVLDQAVKDNGDSFEAGLIYVAGFPPLDRRHAVWEKLKQAHPGIREVAHWGTAESPVATAVADQTAAAFRAHPDIKVVFAPWDEFARGAKLAVDEMNKTGRVRIYSADISTSDIQAMRETNSAWVATAATSPAVVGAVSIRTVAMLLASEDPGHAVTVRPALVTRDLLLKQDIHNVQELAAKVPTFAHSDAALTHWTPVDAR